MVDSPCSHKKIQQGDLLWRRGTKYNNHRQSGGTTYDGGPTGPCREGPGDEAK